MHEIVIAGIIASIIVLIVFATKLYFWSYIWNSDEYEIKKAGKDGEYYAGQLIEKILHEDDIHLRNVAIEYEGKVAELDNLIINKYGVFIIEVKSYKGTLKGSEEDQEWTKFHKSRGGNIYSKSVRNPIPQVKRQTYILGRCLKNHGCRAWIEGYVYFVYHNCPFSSDYVMQNIEELEQAIHTPSRDGLSKAMIQQIARIVCANKYMS